MQRGLTIPTLVIVPGKDLMMSKLEVVRDRRGLLTEVSREFTVRGLNIYHTIAQVSPEGRGFIFICSERTESPADLKRSLENIEGIGEVEIEVSETKGLLITKLFFPLARAGRRVVILTDTALRSMIEEMTRILGGGPANAILFRVGYELGAGYAEVHLITAEVIGIEDPPEVLRKISAPLLESSGFARTFIREMPDGSLDIILEESLEAEVRGRAKEPSCYFMKGILKGALEKIFRKQVSIDEVRCKTADSDFCEFIARIGK